MKSKFIGVLAVAFLLLSAAKCQNIPLPTSTPTVEPPVTPIPSPVCIGENKCGCYAQPKPGEWGYVCCVPWVYGGVLLAPSPAECPEPPLSLCIKPGSDWELQPRTPPPAEHIKALNAALQAETGCDPSNDCPIPVDPVTFRNRVIARLVAGGLCAGVQVDAEDAPIAIGEQNDNWTYHIINFGEPKKVRWQPSANEPPDHWRVKAPPAPTGFPPITQFGRGPNLDVKHPNCLVIDATPLTGSSEYCKAAFSDNPNQWYLCPYAGHDNPAKREAGEKAAGPYTWVWNGVEWEGNTDQDGKVNPLQIKVCPFGPGLATICAYNYGSQICQSVKVQ